MLHKEGEFDKILHDIINVVKNQKKDKFSKKYSFVSCNEFYHDKACLANLATTKDDFASVKGTVNMMGIKPENRTELIDVGHARITKEYDELCDKILASCQPLSSSGKTGIGYKEKFAGFGINWRDLKSLALQLVKDGVITSFVDKQGITRVNLNGLK